MRRAAAVLGLVLAWPGVAVAQERARLAEPMSEQPQEIKHPYSPYEVETLQQSLDLLHEVTDPAPEGKIVEGIEVVPLDVFEERDPVPRFVNVFHVTTRPYVIDREVLVRPGQPYRQALVDETARNLRGLTQLSLVLVVATKGTTPDRVRIVVITKDTWSLRLNWNVALTAGGLQELDLQPSETNLFGTQQTVSGLFTLTPSTYAFGLGYRVPRLEGRWLQLLADANIIVNKATGSPEGTSGEISLTRPLYSALTEWAWGVGASWDNEVVRRYVDAELSAYEPSDPNGIHYATECAPTPGSPCVPYEYRTRQFVQQLTLVRSFGWATKNDFTLGLEFNRAENLTPDFSGYDPAVVAEFVRTQLPVGETRIGPFVQWRGYTTNFVRVLDFETLGLQEDYRLGHDVWVRVYPVLSALGSTRTLLGTYAAAQYTAPLGDGLVRASLESTTEADSQELSDAALGFTGRIVTPRLGFGRFVFDTAILDRYRNYLNHLYYLGGDTRLRGYPSNFLVGEDVITVNTEYRTRPLEVLKVQVGGVAFYDVGDAFNGFENLHAIPGKTYGLLHSIGVGLRTLFPQFDRVVFRGDVGFPIPAPAGVCARSFPGCYSFWVTFGQAFPVYSVGGTIQGAGSTQNGVAGALGQ
jgi:Omp85 superfamily domain